MEETTLKTEQLLDDDVENCPFCGNVYKIIWLKEGDDYNDFGYRHCPFCGLVMDEYAQLVKKKQ